VPKPSAVPKKERKKSQESEQRYKDGDWGLMEITKSPKHEPSSRLGWSSGQKKKKKNQGKFKKKKTQRSPGDEETGGKETA